MYTFLKSTLSELSNDTSHHAENELCQKIITINTFPGTLLIENISETINAKTLKKCFFDATFKRQSIEIYC